MSNISGGDGDPRVRGGLTWQDSRRIFQTALLWVLAALLVFILWRIRYALLIAFGALLVAIVLLALSDLFCKWLRFPRGLSLAASTALVLAVLGGTVWLFGANLATQFNDLLRNVKAGESSLSGQFGGSSGILSTVADRASGFLTSLVPQALSLGLGFFGALLVIFIAGIYLAAQPKLYRRGIAAIFHPTHRARVLQIVELVETTLKLWLLGQIILMIIVGVLTYGALLIIGLPSPIALALIAGIAEIVPYLGPFISAVPALLVALTLGFTPTLWTAVAYLGVHLIEGYIAAPLIERRFITIPPALILFGLIAIEFIFGIGGILLAAPLTAVIYILIKMLYVEDPLARDEGDKKTA